MNRSDRPDAEDPRLGLEPEDAAFVERLRCAFAPEREDAMRRAGFEAGLAERIAAAERPRWRRAPALAAAALAVAVAWLGLRALAPQQLDDAGTPLAEVRMPADPEAPRIAGGPRAEALAWEESLFFPAERDPELSPGAMPGEYRAIAAVFLAGGS